MRSADKFHWNPPQSSFDKSPKPANNASETCLRREQRTKHARDDWYNVRFMLRNQVVADAAPADAAREQRCNKVREIQIRYEDADGDVNPGLRVNLHAIKRQEIGDSDDAEGAAQRSEQQRKKSERRE